MENTEKTYKMAPVSCPQYQPPMPAVKRRGVAPCVIILVGEPARERTSLAHSLRRYLTWTQHQAKVFSYGSDLMSTDYESGFSSSDQFISSESRSSSESVNSQAVFDARSWILAQENNSFAILDGKHATEVIRRSVHDFFDQIGAKVLFIEFVSGCVDGINRNIMEILNLHEDYTRMGLKEEDIKRILENFGNQQITTLGSPSEKNYSYIKYINNGEDVIAHNFRGPQNSSLLNFVSNYKPLPKVIYFSRHGESEYNLLGRIGGDAKLTERGQAYARELARYFNQENRHSDLQVWTSRKIRTIQTASLIQAPTKQVPEIDEIDAGVCEGMTYEEVAEMYPKEMAKRDLDKLRYRYPQGESYIDLMQRLEPVLMEVQSTDKPHLVISHQAILRPVLAYFCPPKSLDEIPYINVPLHTLLKLTPGEHEWNIEYIKFNIECVNTYRKQPKNCSLNRSNEEALSTVPAHLDSVR